MPRYLIFNKPFKVLCQFTDDGDRSTLADYIDVADVYSAGRLDYDSEGLLVLTDDGGLIHSMMHPRFKTPKTYLAQIEGIPSEEDLQKLRQGLVLKDGKTKPCQARLIDQPDWLWPRNPPIRERKNIPTSWLSLTITEGKNRQVRRMTAAIGHPTLRLVRSQIGNLLIKNLEIGQYQEVDLNFLLDNGIKLVTKKGSSNAASHHAVKRSGSRPPRNRHSQNRTRTNGRTRPDSR